MPVRAAVGAEPLAGLGIGLGEVYRILQEWLVVYT